MTLTILGNASAEMLTFLMFGLTILFIFLGIPITFSLFGTAFLVGIFTLGLDAFTLFQMSAYSQLTSYVLLAIPLFIFMGHMMESTGIAKGMFESLNDWIGHTNGGMLVVCVITGAVLAACVGIIAASIVLLAIIAMPVMLERGYNKTLSCGTVCASGCLGILIPPSIMLIIYGPAAGISVGRLFASAFGIGFFIAALYIIYILIVTRINPKLAPGVKEKNLTPLSTKIKKLLVSFVPPVIIILSVLGSIMFGIASPTEASALGCVTTIILSIFYKTFNWKNLNNALKGTISSYAMVMMIIVSAKIFVNLFMRLGCNGVISDLVLNFPGGRWGSFTIIMLLFFILGMLIDWTGIVLIMVPIVTPIALKLGFDPIWFAMMCILNLQTSFLSPPFAQGIFFLKGAARPEWGINLQQIIKGVLPFIVILIITMLLCIVFPKLLTYLPSVLLG